MLRTTITKVKKCPQIFIPRPLIANARYVPNSFEKCGVKNFIVPMAESSSNTGSKDPESDCEKCKRIIELMFGAENSPTDSLVGVKDVNKIEDTRGQNEISEAIITRNFVDNSNDLSSTANTTDKTTNLHRGNEQKMEHIPNNPSAVTLLPEDLRGNRQTILKNKSAIKFLQPNFQMSNVEEELQNKIEKIAKKCLNAAENQIDEKIIREIDKIDVIQGFPPELQTIARKFVKKGNNNRPPVKMEVELETNHRSLYSKEKQSRNDGFVETRQLQSSIPQQQENLNTEVTTISETKSQAYRDTSEVKPVESIEKLLPYPSPTPLDISVNILKSEKDITKEKGILKYMKRPSKVLADETINKLPSPKPLDISVNFIRGEIDLFKKDGLLKDIKSTSKVQTDETINKLSYPTPCDIDVSFNFVKREEEIVNEDGLSEDMKSAASKVQAYEPIHKLPCAKPLHMSVNCVKGEKNIITEDGLPKDMKKYEVYGLDENSSKQNKIRKNTIENLWLIEKEMESKQCVDYLEKTSVINSKTPTGKKKISTITNYVHNKETTPTVEKKYQISEVDNNNYDKSQLMRSETMPMHAFYGFHEYLQPQAGKDSQDVQDFFDFRHECLIHTEKIMNPVNANEQFDKHMIEELKISPNHGEVDSYSSASSPQKTSDRKKKVRTKKKRCNNNIEKTELLTPSMIMFKAKVGLLPPETRPLTDVAHKNGQEHLEQSREIAPTKTEQEHNVNRANSDAFDVKNLDDGKISLQELLKRVRERSRLEFAAQVVGKCDGDKVKPACPPPTPNCQPPEKKSPEDTSKQPCKSPCPPLDPPCPPKKKSPCDKFKKASCIISLDKIFATPILYWLPKYTSYRNIHQGKCCMYKDTILLKKDLRCYETGVDSVLNARDFAPWVPIPSWPLPKELKKKRVILPKEGCKLIPPPRLSEPCQENPCRGLPKRAPYKVLLSINDY